MCENPEPRPVNADPQHVSDEELRRRSFRSDTIAPTETSSVARERLTGYCAACGAVTTNIVPGTDIHPDGPLAACGYHGGVPADESDAERSRRLRDVYSEPRTREER